VWHSRSLESPSGLFCFRAGSLNRIWMGLHKSHPEYLNDVSSLQTPLWEQSCDRRNTVLKDTQTIRYCPFAITPLRYSLHQTQSHNINSHMQPADRHEPRDTYQLLSPCSTNDEPRTIRTLTHVATQASYRGASFVLLGVV
jgi:hypothetical protein